MGAFVLSAMVQGNGISNVDLLKQNNTLIISMIHVGKLIRLKMEEQHLTVVWLASHLSCSRTNVYKMFERYSVDTEVLMKLSIVLDFDFFSLYSDELVEYKKTGKNRK